LFIYGGTNNLLIFSDLVLISLNKNLPKYTMSMPL